MALSAVALCSRALLKLGAEAISSFNDSAAEAEIASALYAPVRDAQLASHPWRFATTYLKLNRLPTAPAAGYPYAYQLPDRFLRAVGLGSGSSRADTEPFAIAGRQLLAEHPSPVLTYIYRPDEEDTPSYFDQVMIARLAAEFCLSLTESPTRARMLAQAADDEIRRARQIDSQQATTQAIRSFPLIEVRAGWTGGR
ncbi:hypothetical protein [Fodinicurvata sp. EGI_FJ10296]|uniref:hypothetical protein n=1 Tax=Fodinicurvata sp. EGI_FJ10296 TaxID=3231908 RepID=UPI003456B9BF